MTTFMSQIETAWREQNSLLCVGLDPELAKIPEHLRQQPNVLFDFCAAIVDATADLVCAFKPQFAYFGALRGEAQLERLIGYIHQRYPKIPVILDVKRGDIGSTAERYAVEAFERYGADAVTLNPYLGLDSVQPFLNYTDKGVILLCRTSNPGGADLQALNVGTPDAPEFLYERVARLIAKDWNRAGNCALVVGATYPAEIGRVRALVGEMPLLVPGIGAQGGDVEATVKAGRTANGTGLIINSSRAILYAGKDKDFAAAARAVALQTRDEINRWR